MAMPVEPLVIGVNASKAEFVICDGKAPPPPHGLDNTGATIRTCLKAPLWQA